jgi:hypothetical protein
LRSTAFVIFLLSVQNEEGARLTVETPQTAEAARDPAERADIKQRAATGAALVAARVPVQATACAGTRLLIAFATVPALGVAAIGIGWVAGSVVDAWLGAAAAHGLTARIGPSIAAAVISLTVYMLVLTATCRDRASEVGQPVIATARGWWAG